jgi:hypothetical protein
MVVNLQVILDLRMIVALSTLKIFAEKNPSKIASNRMRIATSL